MAEELTCLVTIHGIGFEHAPQDGTPGYADGLQQRLQEHLGSLLSGDPRSEFGRPAGAGAVYVHSDWPPDSGKVEEGLRRLGRWLPGDLSHRQLDVTDVPLAEEGRPIAHVALVYAGLEERQPHLGASLETLAKAVISHGNYAGIPTLLGMALRDGGGILEHQVIGPKGRTPGLQVRGAPTPEGVPPRVQPSGPFTILAQLDQDVSTYVVRNDLRERVRSFGHEAILRLCCRDDVVQVVVNAHSQGTVLAFDVLRELPPFAVEKVKALITAGSPLRKYVDLFSWGTDAAAIDRIPWWNFWDSVDPVADPLAPPSSWRPGEPLPPTTGNSQLYQSIDPDTGQAHPAAITDYQVKNAAHGARSGLPAHDYWGNDAQFVQPLAQLLRGLVGARLAK